MDRDYSDPQTVEFALKEWAEVFRSLPRIDAIFVPGGDPGHTRAEIPDGAAGEAGRESAPLSSQSRRCGSRRRASTRHGSTSSIRILDEQPAWLSGIVFGPQVRGSIAESARARPEAVPDPLLSRHHAQPSFRISGPRLGSGLRHHRRTRRYQSRRSARRPSSAVTSAVLPAASSPIRKAATTMSISSSGAAWVGTRRERDRYPARLRPVLHRP